MTEEQGTFHWGHEALHLEIVVADDGSPRLTHLGLPGETQRIPGASLPLVEVTAAGHGRGWSGNRLVGTDLGGRLRHRSHRASHDGDWHTLTVHLHDPETGLAAEVTYRSPDGIPVLRSEVTLRNEGQGTLHLESVSSLAVGCLTPQDPAAIDAADLLWAENDWLTECRWQRQPMRLTTPAHGGRVTNGHGRGGFAPNGQGTWSSCGRLPMGGLTDRITGRTWVWQIEHNGGGWCWAPTLRTPATTYLTAWRRSGTDATAALHLPHLRDTAARVDLLYPSASRAVPAWTPDTTELSLTLPTAPSAVLLRITPTAPSAP
ncbi:glycoside hydrolase family 36 N-terminal domain-containing protein [Streptomyces coeruleofuscus]|uniref:Glycosyl hydrolase family 36 N-terminal domain-containing protein n=1 Tax=Streptomyces coeruleofuscus TaxID=66879 RepID=A0ABP5WFU9_9ACTN